MSVVLGLDGVIFERAVAEMGWQGQRLGISVCRVGILWDYLRLCSCGNGMAGLAFGCFLCTIRFCGGCVWTCNKEIRWEG